MPTGTSRRRRTRTAPPWPPARSATGSTTPTACRGATPLSRRSTTTGPGTSAPAWRPAVSRKSIGRMRT
nr:MAG TPA: hypothetical protein [Caudoviricetes sp.]